MIRALAWRHLISAVRLPAVWAAVLVHVAALLAYVFVWGTGIPLAGARSPFEQFATAQSVALLAVLPWVVARCATVGDRDAGARLAVLSACQPGRLMLAAALGLALVGGAIALTGLPLAVLSHEIAEGAGLDLAASQLRATALAAWAATVTVAAVSLSGSRLGGWVMGTATAALVVRLLPAGGSGTAALAVASIAVAAAASQHAQRYWQHRVEHRA